MVPEIEYSKIIMNAHVSICTEYGFEERADASLSSCLFILSKYYQRFYNYKPRIIFFYHQYSYSNTYTILLYLLLCFIVNLRG